MLPIGALIWLTPIWLISPNRATHLKSPKKADRKARRESGESEGGGKGKEECVVVQQPAELYQWMALVRILSRTSFTLDEPYLSLIHLPSFD